MGDPADIGPQYQCDGCLTWGPAEVCATCEAEASIVVGVDHGVRDGDDTMITERVVAPLTIDGQVVVPGQVIAYGHVRVRAKGKRRRTFTGGVYSVSIDMVLNPEASAALQKAIDETFGPKDGDQ